MKEHSGFPIVVLHHKILIYGVPRGSVLGPLLSSLYNSPLGQIIRGYEITFLCYPNDNQLKVPIKANDQSKIIINLIHMICWSLALLDTESSFIKQQ